jgi:hypothetical protein
MTPEEEEEALVRKLKAQIEETRKVVSPLVRAYWIRSCIHEVRSHLRRAWPSWVIFFVVVVVPSLDEDESRFGLRFLTFLAGMFAAMVAAEMAKSQDVQD